MEGKINVERPNGGGGVICGRSVTSGAARARVVRSRVVSPSTIGSFMASVRPMQLEVGLDGSTRPLAGTGTVCSRMDCFKPALQSRVHASGTVIMAVTNAGFAAFWHNLRCSLERVGLAQHALVVGTDRDACSAANAPGVYCLVGESLFWPEEAAAELKRTAVSHGTRPYARLMQVKARPTLEALRLGFNVLTTDTVPLPLPSPCPGRSRSRSPSPSRSPSTSPSTSPSLSPNRNPNPSPSPNPTEP